MNEACFWRHVRKTDTCWLWTGSRNFYGYGWFKPGKRLRKEKAHRVAYALACGPIPPGLLVLHRCDNPPCVRPDHLWLGTTQDNIDDRIRKGRTRAARGESCGRVKLTEADVIAIRRTYKTLGWTYHGLAAAFHISPSQVGEIIRGGSWRHVL